MYVNANYPNMSFSVVNNVYIDVIDTETNIIRKHIEKHNKATRGLVTGILRYLSGEFTPTMRNDKPLYSDSAKNYVPCYLNVGDGGVLLDPETGLPMPNEEAPNNRIPALESSWDYNVPYDATSLVREFFTQLPDSEDEDSQNNNLRTVIRKETDTTESPVSADMDSLYFYCEIGPGTLNSVYKGNFIYITELGLFSSAIPGTEDLLAYIKLANYEDAESINTDVLYVRPADTVVVRWIITIAAIGRDGVLVANIRDEHGEIIQDNIIGAPNAGTFTIIEDDGQEENNL